jgi:hypothetical protein
MSRPEVHIQMTFKSPSIQSKTYHLDLQDFNAHDNIHRFLGSQLLRIRQQVEQLMYDVPKTWPSEKDLEVLVEQSEGLFIYASTLMKFIGDGNDVPQRKLQVVMTVHTGLNPLYDQILSEVPRYPVQFEWVMGAVMFLHRFFSVGELGQFLQLESGSVRIALCRCQSILVIPNDNDKDFVRPYHTSLQGFLTDHAQAKNHFF